MKSIYLILMSLILISCGTIQKKKPKKKVFRQNFAMTASQPTNNNKNMKKICHFVDEETGFEVIQVKKGKVKNHLKNNPNDLISDYYYPDMDGDGYGDADADIAPQPCPLKGYVRNNTDCYDHDPNINPEYSDRCHEPRVRMCEDGRQAKVDYLVKVSCLSCSGNSKGVCMNSRNKCRALNKNGKCPNGFYICGQEVQQCTDSVSFAE